MNRVIKDWFTEPDNHTYCLVKAITGSGAIIFFICSLIHVIQNKSFDFLNFGMGLGAIMGGAGVGLGMKKDTQP